MYRTHPDRKGAMEIVSYVIGALFIVACALTLPSIVAIMRWEDTDKQVRYEYRAPINRSERVVIPAHPHRIRTTALWFFVELLSIGVSVFGWLFITGGNFSPNSTVGALGAVVLGLFGLVAPVTTFAVLDSISKAQRKRA